MILPYSTDAPIYHFPWMTIVLIVVNCLTFALTGMGYDNDGWLLQYGNGLHPLEWVAYNFLHFGVGHLLGNMFFLWAFGIVIEGKLGWWKFLGVYMTIGIVGGFLIQLTMLGYKSDFDFSDLSVSRSRGSLSWFEPTPAFAQDDDGADEPDMAPGKNSAPVGNFPVGEMDPGDDEPMTPEDIAQKATDEEMRRLFAGHFKPGAGGASLVVFALLGIVLVWAPKNEISCLWIGLNAGTFEMEYVYFCGFKIGIEILGTLLGGHGYEVTSEVAHALGAVMGFGVGAAFVKLNWVDCENWDLFAYAQNKHGSMEHVGSWQDAAAIAIRNDKRVHVPVRDDDDDEPRLRANRKKRAMPKLQALKSLDDEVVEEDVLEEGIEILDEPDAPPKKSKARKSPEAGARTVPPLPPIPTKPAAGRVTSPKPAAPVPPPAPAPAADVSPIGRIRSALKADKLSDALNEFRRQRSFDPGFQLPMAELRGLADGFFKQQNVRDSKPLFEEFIERFPAEADRQRVKLAVLNVKFFKRPTAALKLLAKVNRNSLPDEYQSIHKEAARQAQQMISDGMVDAS
ncbi:MAG: rhomboid family intramembrane serine protease [Planctomycetota bacterium]